MYDSFFFPLLLVPLLVLAGDLTGSVDSTRLELDSIWQRWRVSGCVVLDLTHNECDLCSRSGAWQRLMNQSNVTVSRWMDRRPACLTSSALSWQPHPPRSCVVGFLARVLLLLLMEGWDELETTRLVLGRMSWVSSCPVLWIGEVRGER
jgi:hypothetical protein